MECARIFMITLQFKFLHENNNRGDVMHELQAIVTSFEIIITALFDRVRLH